MMKRLVLLCACLGLTAVTVSCTSTSTDSESTSEYEDVTALESAEGSTDSLLMGGELGEEEVSSDANAISEETSVVATTDDEAIESVTPSEEVAASEVLPEDTTLTDTAATDSLSEPAVEPVAEPLAETTELETVTDLEPSALAETPEPTQDAFSDTASTEVPMSETTTLTETTTTTSFGDTSADTSSSSTSYASSSFADEKPKTSLPLQKMASTPWKQGGTLYNTIYFARPGDSLKSISMMIYGSDKTSELKKGNPTFKSRGVKPGDKVYYQSPNRPSDESRIITYYEDMGMSPEVYVAQSGENIRSVSKKLLGYSDAWKEVWSSNEVESKAEMMAGTQLRYWKAPAQAAPVVAPVAEVAPSVPEPVAPQVEQAPPQPEVAQTESLDSQLGNYVDQGQDPQAMAQNEMAPPPADAMAEMPPPPPPPPMEMAPPPPPPMAADSGEMAAEEQPLDQDMTLALGVVGIAAAGLAGLIVARKKRKQREAEEALQQTHVG